MKVPKSGTFTMKQEKDLKTDDTSEMKTVTNIAPTNEQLSDLEFASKLKTTFTST